MRLQEVGQEGLVTGERELLPAIAEDGLLHRHIPPLDALQQLVQALPLPLAMTRDPPVLSRAPSPEGLGELPFMAVDLTLAQQSLQRVEANRVELRLSYQNIGTSSELPQHVRSYVVVATLRI